jgi:hypothetical protein
MSNFALFLKLLQISVVVILDFFEIHGGKNIFYRNFNFPPKKA